MNHEQLMALRRVQLTRQKEAREARQSFWCDVFVASIRAGSGERIARRQADYAADALRAKWFPEEEE